MDTERIIILSFDTADGREDDYFIVPIGRNAEQDITSIVGKLKVSDLGRFDDISHRIGSANVVCAVERALEAWGYESWFEEEYQRFHFGSCGSFGSGSARPYFMSEEVFQKIGRWNDRMRKRFRRESEKHHRGMGGR